MRVVGPLNATNPGDWALMPQLLTRAERFCTERPTDVLFEQLREFIISGFRKMPPSPMGAVVIVNDEGDVIGHAISSVEGRGRERVGFVVQYEVDQGVPQDLRDLLMDILRTWARPHNVVALEAITWLPPKVLQRYGFTTFRTIMRAPLETVNGERT